MAAPMNYYPHHIGDYKAATAHLSNNEDLAYRRLLEMYYDTEKPIPVETQWVSRRLRLDTEAIEAVLNDFFSKHEDGWRHARCDIEIAAYKEAKKNHWAAGLTKSERAEIQGRRNATKVNATPKWLTHDDLSQIASIYSEAAKKTASTGVPHEVDHIVPLRSKVVCGLHAPWNLQILTASKNRSKSNYFEVS